MSSSRGSPGSAPFSQRCGPREKVVDLPLARSFTPLGVELRGLTPSAPPQSCEERTASACRAVKRGGLRRSSAPCDLRAPDVARSREASPDVPLDLCNLAIHEHRLRSPETPSRTVDTPPRGDAVFLGSRPVRPSTRAIRVAWPPRGGTPVELHRNRTRSARAAQVLSIHVKTRGMHVSPRGAEIEQAVFRSASLGHLLS